MSLCLLSGLYLLFLHTGCTDTVQFHAVQYNGIHVIYIIHDFYTSMYVCVCVSVCVHTCACVHMRQRVNF